MNNLNFSANPDGKIPPIFAQQHAVIMRHFGSYKLSIHTGSGKFSIYPIIALPHLLIS